MITKSFFGLSKPKFSYELLTKPLPEIHEIPLPETVTLFLDRQLPRKTSELIKIGQNIKTGQLLKLESEDAVGVVSPVSGEITGINPYLGDYGKNVTAIDVMVLEEEQIENGFSKHYKDPSVESLDKYLSSAPGSPCLRKFADPEKPITKIVIHGGDTDLITETNLYILKTKREAIEKGIQILKDITKVKDIILTIPGESIQGYDSHIGAEVLGVSSEYPAYRPLMIMIDTLKQPVPPYKTCEDIGISFIRVEAVATIGEACMTGQIPKRKILTLIDKKGRKRLISATLGTPIKDIFKSFNISINDKDRIIFGGPMTGNAVYSEDHPVTPDTEAIVVQDSTDIRYSSDYPCINCGECVRICPTHVPVNLLVRFLEAGQYEEAADLYDLFSCIECGLCSFVCVSRIPIFQYIKLAKFELARTATTEEANE